MHCHILCKSVRGNEYANVQRFRTGRSFQTFTVSQLVNPLSPLSGQDSIEGLCTAAALTGGVLMPTTEAV